MAEFIVFAENVEVVGQTVFAFINSMKRGQEKRKSILLKHGIDPKPEEWYPQQKWLDAFKEVSESVGEMNLFLIGVAIIENAEFPPINNLKEGLGAIEVAYHMSHRINGNLMFNPENGEMLEGIGHYGLKEYNEDERTAIMVCDNPYPSKFDEGIITAVGRKFQPSDSEAVKVKVDVNADRRTKGGSSCTYLISW